MIGTGAALQAVVGAGLFRQTTGMIDPFARARDAAAFVAIALGGCLINATVSTASLTLGGYVAWPDVGETWLTWWLGDASGVLVVAPLLLAWAGGPPPLRANRLPGLVVLLALPFAVGHAVARTGYPLEYLYLPPLTWAAFRFGPRGATVLTALTAGVAIATTVQGLGAFRGPTPNESLMLLQAFAGTVAASTLLLVGVIAQRDTAERELAAAIGSLEARVRLRTQELAAANTRLQRIAGVDPLTGVANRRQFDETLRREWRRCGRAGVPLAVILMDIDHFKKFNDAYGHLAGDECLRRVAEALAGGLQRSGELLARYGGEEFVALLPGATADDGLRTAERLRQRVAAAAIPHQHSPTQAVTLSGGVAAVVPVGPESPLPLLAAADGALYEAKRAGRNCVRRAVGL
jgi:diguanylate cyclase (GGDEF)-like protein